MSPPALSSLSRLLLGRPCVSHSGAPLCGLLVLALMFNDALHAETPRWPQFRGPNARGVIAEPAPTTWDVEKQINIRWITPIPGLAHSSPIIWNDRIYALTATQPEDAELKVGLYGNIDSVNETEAHAWRLLALNRVTGEILWNSLAVESVPRIKRHTKSTHANSTPATDGRSIVALCGSEGLFCFNTNGRLKWKQDLGPLDSGYYLSKDAQWGFASSPVIHDGKVVVQCDVQEGSFLAVFDLEDGHQVWRTARQDVPTWSTPTIATTHDRVQIVVNGWRHLGSYDFANGSVLWHLSGGGDIPVPTPVLGNGLVYLTSAHGNSRPIRAIRLDATGDISPDDVGATNASVVWTHPRKGNYMQTPILVGDHLYGCTDNGVLSCFNALTGEVQYEERLGRGREGFTASPVSAGGQLYVTSETGTVFVIPATGRFSIAATNELMETCLATPALGDNGLFFRTRTRLMAIGEPAGK